MVRRTKEEADLTRIALLKAALSVFSRKGYASSTLEDVAREAGVTRGAIYWHFGSKAELYVALLNEYSGRSDAIIQAAAVEGGTLVEILRRVFVRMLEAVESDPALKEMMGITLFKTERSPDLIPSFQKVTENSRLLVNNIAEVMRQGISSGELRTGVDPLDMGRAFLAFQNGAIYLWLQDPSAFSLAKSAPALAEIYLRGIVSRS
jgi:TetR/AcrR family transcriptional regulator, acrAB operon repressor